MAPSLYERAGGVAGIRSLLEDFYGRVFQDPMIGFLFHGRDRNRLVQRELELIASFLGGPQRYRGRPLEEVHRPLPILGGHFDRRQVILAETLRDHGLPEEVVAAWLEHGTRLRPWIEGQGEGESSSGPGRGRPS